jgi:hypothetical protein
MEDTRSRGVSRAFSEQDRQHVRSLNIADAAAKFRVSEKNVDRLNEYYRLVRKRVKEDALMIQKLAEHGDASDAQIEAWENDRVALSKMAAELGTEDEAVKRLANLIYASVPGYSLREYGMLPEMYYVFDEQTGALDYIGPASDASLAEMSSPYITVESPFYVAWVYLNHDRYEHWAKKHQETYSRLTSTEPKLAAAVRGQQMAERNSSGHESRATVSRGSTTVSRGSTTTESRTTGGSWGRLPPTTARTPSTRASRSTTSRTTRP